MHYCSQCYRAVALLLELRLHIAMKSQNITVCRNPQTGDSILAPGGSISNMYALMIARHKLYPQHKKHGMRAIKGQLIMYTSRHVSGAEKQ